MRFNRANRFDFATFLTLAALTSLTAAEEHPDGFGTLFQPVFQENCIKCHGKDGKVKGKVNLLDLRSAADLTKDTEFLEDLILVLSDREMPPEDEPPLPSETREQMVAELQALLHATVSSQKSLPQAPIRRMNRFQYGNAVQDLFDLKVEVFTLPERILREHGDYFKPETGKMPQEVKAGSRPLGKSQLIEKRLGGVVAFPQDLRAEHGFDNRGDHLSLSPFLLESFLKLSRSIVESPDFTGKNCGIWESFFETPAEGEDLGETVRTRLRQFLTKAFRRPIGDAVFDRYAGHVLAQMEAGETFTDSMKTAASAALASPRFLYLYDGAGTGVGAEPLDDFELASRLSFFLWGSIPDQTLLDVAAAGKLHEPEILKQQVARMLNDGRLKRFCDSFPGQWLQLERIISSVPDPDTNPEFYFAKYRASMHMMLEPLLLFETIVVENRPILELIDSDFSYRSALLESWYRDGTRGKKATPVVIPFKRVPVTDRRQGGVITNAAVMTMTSNPTRTQPITRGAWIASVIFNDPPEPPPADVPPLPEEPAEEEKKLTLRERLNAHREREDCKGCHAQIDPLGFALENYGPTGIWRDEYENGRKVDSAGLLFRKHEFSTPAEFKDAILIEKNRFARAFAAHLLSFALGRETGAADSPSLGRIVEETARGDYRIQSLIEQIALSESFLYKSNPPESDSD